MSCAAQAPPGQGSTCRPNKRTTHAASGPPYRAMRILFFSQKPLLHTYYTYQQTQFADEVSTFISLHVHEFSSFSASHAIIGSIFVVHIL